MEPGHRRQAHSVAAGVYHHRFRADGAVWRYFGADELGAALESADLRAVERVSVAILERRVRSGGPLFGRGRRAHRDHAARCRRPGDHARSRLAGPSITIERGPDPLWNK